MKRTFETALAILLLSTCCPTPTFTQEKVLPDSSRQYQLNFADSSGVGHPGARPFSDGEGSESPATTVARVQPVKSGLDAKVEYSARTIDSRDEGRVIYLLGDAKVQYKEIVIEAGKITINMDENILTAEAVPDSSLNSQDSTAAKKRGLPTFSDGKDKMTGEYMEFNFESEKGRITRGRTEFQKGYYFGDAVKRVDSDVFFVADGKYSTCDKDEPHYHFRGKKMKVIANDKVLAKPVVFFMGKIPLAIFPFAMFPTQESGRQSGIILPQYGSSPTEGRYLRNMGYYWATSDYLDMQFNMDFYEKTGILFRGKMNYALRYKFNGGLDGSFTHKNFPDGRRERRWNLLIRHSQTIDENTSFSVNANLQNSNTFYKELSDNRAERLNRQINSNATFSKRWGKGKNSLTLNVRQVKDLESGKESLTLPQLNFTRSRSALFLFKDDETGRTKRQPKWFNQIFYDYRTSVTNVINDDTTDSPPEDVRKANHRMSFSFTPTGKLFGVLGLNQSLTYEEDWFDNRKEDFTLIDSTNTFDSNKKSGFFRRYKYSYSANTSTNIYGTFPGIARVKAFRHKMSPSVGFSFTPDFTDKYYVAKKDTQGVVKQLDRFQGSPRGKSMNMNFRLNNLFQMKVTQGDKERVIKLFDVNFSSSYNFAADSLRLSNLSSSILANPTKNFGITMRTSHSFYRFDNTAARRVNRFVVPQLTSLSFDARWSLRGKENKAKNTAKGSRDPAAGEPLTVTQLGATGPQASGEYEDALSPMSAFSALDIPWRANLSFSYSINKTNPNFVSRTAYIDLSNVELQLTKNWRIGYRLRYDLKDTKVVDQRLSFYRALHCWEARFDWSPSGFSKGYYFIINIKAPHLRQVKLERRGGTTSVFNPFQ